MIPVTKAFLPEQKEYQYILKKAWDSSWITNRGKLVLKLENQLKSYLKVKHLLATTNGTLPIQLAIKSLDLKGEVITTPFSYVATTSSIVWESCKPVFVDIDEDYWTIDENKIEAAITKNTSAILATHVFGNPCNVEIIEDIASKNGLKVIYDAAHCFGVKYKGKSIFEYGDISTCSFHATKIFHTGEGGALFTNDKDLYDKCFYHHNFGHDGPEKFHGIGINAKMSEMQAAMGLAVFPFFERIKKNRNKLVNLYRQMLATEISLLKIREGTDWNYSYFPILFNNKEILLKVKENLEHLDIWPRRYFYPSLNKLPYLKYIAMPISESISKRVLCLPLFDGLKIEEVELICETINNSIHA